MEIEEALKRILDRIEPGRLKRQIPLTEACGAVLAEDIIAERNVPSFPRSAMDGYAVHSAEVMEASRRSAVSLRVTEELAAGDVSSPDADHGEGTAVRIMTGACVPDQYDAVVRQEDTDCGNETVEIYAGVKAYQNYCKAGEDIAEGTLVIGRGKKLTAAHLSLIAELGYSEVLTYAPARIALISTGSELLDVGTEPEPGKIYNSIAYLLQAAVRQKGLEVESYGICPDEEDKLKRMLEKALDTADFIITTGGVSVGKRDIVPSVLKSMGGMMLFQYADIQPGTPTTAFTIGNKVVLSLSGNPYAALANFELYFWDSMAKFMHCDELRPVCRIAEMSGNYEKKNLHRRLLRAFYDDGVVKLIDNIHASSVIRNLTECNCFIDLEAGRTVKTGDKVRVRLFNYL